jgi:hypothetical protein
MLAHHTNGVNHDAHNSSPSQTLDKVQLLAGQPVTMQLQHAKPQAGTGKFGEWWRYTVVVDGQRQSFFVPSRSMLDALTAHGTQRGSTLTITKRETLVNGKRSVSYQCALDGVTFEVNGPGQPKPQPQPQPQPRDRARLADDVDALFGNGAGDSFRNAQPPTVNVAGYTLTPDDLSDVPQTTKRHVHVELSTGVFKFTLQELSELIDWLMVNGVTVA